MKKLAILIGFVLIVAGLWLSWTKSQQFGLPLTPKGESSVWDIQAKVVLDTWEEKRINMSLAMPESSDNYLIKRETFESRHYGAAMIESGKKGTIVDNRRLEWSGLTLAEPHSVVFKITVAESPVSPSSLSSTDKFLTVKLRDEQIAEIGRWRKGISREDPLNDILCRVKGSDVFFGKNAKLSDIRDTFRYLGFPARSIKGLPLVENSRDLAMESRVQVFVKDHWVLAPQECGKSVDPHFFIWTHKKAPVFTISRPNDGMVQYSAVKITPISFEGTYFPEIEAKGLALVRYLWVLPVETQALFRIILVFPLGALIVAVIRNLIGIRTYGTFMPVLIALSFRETKLLWGVALFSVVILFGLVARVVLEKLRLLIIPRLAATLTIVVGILITFTAVGVSYDIPSLPSAALFPLIIMTMTIERMSITAEESGIFKALFRAVTSIASAVLVYLVAVNYYSEYLFFTFPELLLCVLGVSILLGKYTGYRLNELYRFKNID
ncbi:MAG: UUP1 family membrane protein [bacterium]|nr:UUP1 family membrane protein [bacterium]